MSNEGREVYELTEQELQLCLQQGRAESSV